MVKSNQAIKSRIGLIQGLYAPLQRDRQRINAIMNGGAEGIKALLGNRVNLATEDIPALNMFLSGVTRMGQALGIMPGVKAAIVPTARGVSREQAVEKADKISRIVRNYDNGRLGRQMRQAGRWLPGYGFVPMVLTERMDRAGIPYPTVEVRDPYNSFVGFWSNTNDPEDMYTTYTMPAATVKRVYGVTVEGSGGTALYQDGQGMVTDGVIIQEYIDETHRYIYVPGADKIVEVIESPVTASPLFVSPRRVSFDRLRGQYDDAIGLLAYFAKLSVLVFIASEESVFRETNVFGGIKSQRYQRGRRAVNHFPRDAKVDRPSNDFPQAMMPQLDRIERQLRIATQYPLTDDGLSPISFVTGQGIDRLSAPTDRTLTEYQEELREALELLDAGRLQWDETMYPDMVKPMRVDAGDTYVFENYVPSKDIKGRYFTKRDFGILSGLDDPTKIVALLQMLQAEVVNLDFVRENIRGLTEHDFLRDGSRRDAAEKSLRMSLEQSAAQGDPMARATLASIFIDPSNAGQIIADAFPTVEELQAQMAQQTQQGQQGELVGAGVGASGGTPPDAQTVLTQLLANGQTGGGVQTVGRF